jgi:mRNA interferase MazF
VKDVQRGEVWWTRFGDAGGAAPAFTRPAVVVQSDAFNRSAIETVMVATMTSNLDRARASGNVVVTAKQSGLDKDSVVNVSQVMTVDRSDLLEHAGNLSAAVMARVDEGLRLALDLGR